MLTPTALLELSARLPVHSEHLPRDSAHGQRRLIKLRPQTYQPKPHSGSETSICLQGLWMQETAAATVQVQQGMSSTAPPGRESRVGPISAARLLMVFG